ncbi:FAD-dependent monooxygenase [Stigmatella sp. ncwal1]|uniref:FAD-dependent monooxygenase n=1 Tax=Stigmatella ashevillensis TaxID=2995309 RepID=A0ABT5DH51_9BACT|nr:FAD-dependent monooxygenase [Stigmatella ashevillena]MDC0711691.1 FAD-dependent monooxygenase [Stigmatella ashevillena]
MNSTTPKRTDTRVLVSGASISGLTIAYWLVRYGFAVTMVERAPHLRPGGHALDVRGPALEVAERMAILGAMRERSTKLTGMAVVDSDGQEIFRSTESTLTGGRLDSADVEIMRDDLCHVLHEAVGDQVEYIFGDSIESLTQDGSGVDVTFVTAAPRRFELVIGADGLYSRVRRIAFGPDEQFLRTFGDLYVATFGMPNFLGLERWQVMYQQPDSVGALVMGLRKDVNARAYLGFSAPKGIDYDFRDIDAQKRLLADRVAGAGWVIPQIVEHMLRATDFHFYSLSQVRMNSWSRGRIVLVGDAGYAISLGTGQGTTVAMVGAYVLAGGLATHKDDLVGGIAAYEDGLRAYVIRNQDIALEQNAQPDDPTDEGETASPGGIPDFGALTLPFALKND